MAFREIELKAKTASGGPQVSASITLPKKDVLSPKVAIGINAAALAEAGLKTGARVRVLIGEGDEAGLIRIEAASDGPVTLGAFWGPKGKRVGGSAGTVIRFSDPAFVCDTRAKRAVSFDRLADPAAPGRHGAPRPVLGLQIQLPKSFFPQPIIPVGAVPRPVVAPAPMIPAKGNATATVMGDPPAGRSALAAKRG